MKKDYHKTNANIQKNIGKAQEKMVKETVKTFVPNARIPEISSTSIKSPTKEKKEDISNEDEEQCCCIKSNNK